MMHGGRAGNGSTNGYVLVSMVTLTALFAANYVRRARRGAAAAIAPPLCISYSWLSVLVTFMMGARFGEILVPAWFCAFFFSVLALSCAFLGPFLDLF
jgi:hypothetical protein